MRFESAIKTGIASEVAADGELIKLGTPATRETVKRLYVRGMRATRKRGSLFVAHSQFGNCEMRVTQIPCGIWAAVEGVAVIRAVGRCSRHIGKAAGQRSFMHGVYLCPVQDG